jgi:hypothetical protein
MLWRVLSGLALVLSGVETEAATAAPAIPGVSFLDGKQASFLLQHPLASFRVYAFHAGVAVDIPFQIDERDRRDRWVLDQGAKLSADETAGVFDENDVLVFMNRDLGQKGAFAALPAGAMVWGEVRVGNATAPLGFAYVGVFEYPPPLPCPTCAVTRYEEASDRVYAERYALEFHSPLPRHIAFVDKLGEFGANVVAGVHANGEVRFLGGLVTLHKTDADIKTELLGYRNGPVRTIRRARYWIPLPFGFHTAGRVDLLFYRDFVEGTALLKIGISPSLVLANGELQAYFDFLHLDGARVFLDGIGPSEPVDGHMTPAKQSLVGRPARWAALILPQGRTVVFIIHLEGALQQLDQRVYFADSPQPDDKAGGRPLFGFHLGQMNRLKTGTHRLSVFAQVLDSVDLDEIRNAVNVFLSPPEVAVSAFTR